MKIAVGSTNPVKLNAVKQALTSLYPQADFIPVAVDSGVKHQPDSIKETQKGATNRCLNALKHTQADLAVGIEGGIFKLGKEMYNFAWAAVADQQGNVGYGGGMCFLVPPALSTAIAKGREMGPAMDQLTGTKNIKKQGGVISVITNNLTNRTAGYVELVKMAMAKFIKPEFYRD